MDIAKNFADYGHWATNKLSFTSATSSPLWTLILSGIFFLTGVNVFTPFILNVIFGIIAIYIAYYILKDNNVTKYLFVILLIFIYVTPLLVMLFTGMEHTAQIVINLLFVYLGCKLIISKEKNNNALKYLLLITPLITSIRYEGIFLISVVALLLIIRKKMLYAGLILLLGFLPIIIYGLISTSHGWYFLPNTILLKSGIELSLSSIPKLIYRAYKNITQPHIFLMLIAGITVIIYRYKRLNETWSEKQVFLMLFILTAIINMSLIDYNENGWFYRYEAYLMAMGVIAIVIGTYDLMQNLILYYKTCNNRLIKLLLPVFILIVCSPLIMRVFTIFLIPGASNNIYEQHFQVGQFVKNCDPGINIAANDIGMINLYSNNEFVDLWGLANMDAASSKIKKNYDTKKYLIWSNKIMLSWQFFTNTGLTNMAGCLKNGLK